MAEYGTVLFNGFQNHLNLRRAKLAQASAEAQREIAENNVVLTIAGAFLNVLFEEFVRVAEYNRQATARQVDRMRSRPAGAAAEFDLYDVEAQLAADEANIVSTNNALGLAKLNLVQLLQLPASEADGFELVRPSDEDLQRTDLPSSPATAVAYALSAFPEIQQAELQDEDAFIGLELPNQRYPRSSPATTSEPVTSSLRSIEGEPLTELLPWVRYEDGSPFPSQQTSTTS